MDLFSFLGDSHRIQTYNLLIRSQMLYSVELANLTKTLTMKYCDSHRIQTYNLLIRSQMLYSVELANQAFLCQSLLIDDAKVGLIFESPNFSATFFGFNPTFLD